MQKWLGVLACVAPWGCGASLDLPNGAHVQCERDDQCPEGWECRTELRRCFEPGGDGTLPALVEGSFAASRTRVGQDVTVELSFAVTEPLSQPPTVQWRFTAAAPAAVTEHTANDLEYSFVYTASGAEPAGGADLSIELVDESGNPGRADFPQVVVFDFSAPEVSFPQLVLLPDAGNVLTNVLALRAGGTARAIFYANEPVATDPVVVGECGSHQLLFTRQPGETSPTFFSFVYDVQPGDEGTCSVSAWLTDEAGNQTLTPALVGTLLIDETSPDTAEVRQDRFVHLRMPWGAERSSGNPRQYLVAAEQQPHQPLGDTCQGDTPCIQTDAFASSNDTVVLVRVFDRQVGGGELGRSFPAAGGFTPVELVTLDSAELWLELVDHAGNASARVRVQHGAWLATLGGKVPFDIVSNPHQALELRAMSPSLAQPGLPVELGAASGIASLGVSGPTTAGGLSWRRVRHDVYPHGRTSGAMAFEPARGRTLLFGGEAEVSECDDEPGGVCQTTWDWDGTRWHRLEPVDPEGDGNPPATRFPLLAHDPVRGRSVLLRDGIAEPGRTWEWTGASWVNACPLGACGTEPSTRHLESDNLVAAMAYDPQTGMVVVLNDAGTFGWDGVAWNTLCTPGTCPQHPTDVGGPAADPGVFGEGVAMAFDATRQRLVAFGASTWEWDGADWHLMPITDTGDGEPSRRVNHRLAYDPVGERVLLLGGFNTSYNCDGNGPGPGGQFCDTTWAWTGTQWADLDPDVVGYREPGGLMQAAVATDTLRGQVFVYSGSAPNGFCEDTTNNCSLGFAWTGERWVQTSVGSATAYPQPPGASHGSITWSPSHDRVLMVPSGVSTWEWSGNVWRRLCNSADCSGPPDIVSRASARLAAHPTLGDAFLFGGQAAVNPCPGFTDQICGDQWVWDYHGGACDSATQPCWDEIVPATRPTQRRNHALATMSRRTGATTLLYGGDKFGGSAGLEYPWEFNGTTWTRYCDGSPASDTCAEMPGLRTGAAMAYDAAHDQVVMFGGRPAGVFSCDDPTDCLADTWLWGAFGAPTCGASTPRCWQQAVVAGGGPGPRAFAAMTYDADLERVLMVGGEGADNQLWSWDGTTWTAETVFDPEGDGSPPALNGALLTYDPSNQHSVLFGGAVVGAVGPGVDRTWVLDSHPNATPAQLASIFLDTMQTPTATLAQLEVTWYARGRASSGNGAALLHWDGAAWVEQAANTALDDGSPVAPCPISGSPAPGDACLRWSTTDAATLTQLEAAPRRALHLAVAPRGGSGTVRPSVTSEYFEVEVRYVLP